MGFPTNEDFQNELNNLFSESWKKNEPFIEIRSGDLHTTVGGYPGKGHKMSLCCSVMLRNMKGNDEIIRKPAKGIGASLIIRYFKR